MEQAVSGYYVLDVIGKQLTQFLSKAQSSGYSTRRIVFCAAVCYKKVQDGTQTRSVMCRFAGK